MIEVPSASAKVLTQASSSSHESHPNGHQGFHSLQERRFFKCLSGVGVGGAASGREPCFKVSSLGSKNSRPVYSQTYCPQRKQDTVAGNYTAEARKPMGAHSDDWASQFWNHPAVLRTVGFIHQLLISYNGLRATLTFLSISTGTAEKPWFSELADPALGEHILTKNI